MTAVLKADRRITFKKPLSWSNSGALSRNDSSFVMVDPVLCRLEEYAFSGLTKRFRTKDGLNGCPVLVQPVPQGYLVELEDAQFIWLDHELNLLPNRVNLADGRRLATVLGLFSWTAVEEHSILGFMDIKERTGKTRRGVVRMSLLKHDYELIHPLDGIQPLENIYRIGNSYFAALGSRGFFYSSVGKRGIYEAGMVVRQVPLLWGDYARFNTIPRLGLGPQNLLKHLEAAPALVGMFAQDGDLYLLVREPAIKGTDWWLIRKNSCSANEVLDAMRLPTKNNHLVVMPGNRQWVFVEKGPIVGPGNQKILGGFVISTASIKKSALGSQGSVCGAQRQKLAVLAEGRAAAGRGKGPR